jgi:UDP-N-acetylmuramoylalanine--D-glutamate ligase
MKITEKLDNRHILIWGKGREGKSSEKFLSEHCPGATYEMVEGSEEDISKLSGRFDFILKSPGTITHVPDPKYISQTRLFMEEFRSQIVGITGTRGKSTTSSLLYSVL